MITKELQNLSDKLVGSHTSAHEISKQVDYIEKNYEGGGSGGGPIVFTAVGTFDGASEQWVYALEDGTTFADIAEHADAGDPMFLRVINQYDGGTTGVVGVYPVSDMSGDVEFGTTRLFDDGSDVLMFYQGYVVNDDGSIRVISVDTNLHA